LRDEAGQRHQTSKRANIKGWSSDLPNRPFTNQKPCLWWDSILRCLVEEGFPAAEGSGRVCVRRCGGGKSPGAPKGNKNAWKHGRYSAESIAMRRTIRALLSSARETISFR